MKKQSKYNFVSTAKLVGKPAIPDILKYGDNLIRQLEKMGRKKNKAHKVLNKMYAELLSIKGKVRREAFKKCIEIFEKNYITHKFGYIVTKLFVEKLDEILKDSIKDSIQRFEVNKL